MRFSRWSPFFLMILFAVCITLTSCGGGGGGSSSNGPVTLVIGPGGGSIQSSDGKLTLDVPAGALAQDTEITVQFRQSNQASLLFYELLPAGLVFQLPARMTIDVSNIMVQSSAQTLTANKSPVIITGNPLGDAFEPLGNHVLSFNVEANQFLLSGDISHFSRFVAGGDLGLRLRLDNVPESVEANTSFGPVLPVLSYDPSPETRQPGINFVNYNDGSSPPVFSETQATIPLTPVPAPGEQRSYQVLYACGDPGVGTYQASVFVSGREAEFVSVYRPIEVNIAAAFIFGPDVIDGGETRIQEQIQYRSYTFLASRSIQCGADTPVENPTVEPTPEASPEPTPDGDTEEEQDDETDDMSSDTTEEETDDTMES